MKWLYYFPPEPPPSTGARSRFCAGPHVTKFVSRCPRATRRPGGTHSPTPRPRLFFFGPNRHPKQITYIIVNIFFESLIFSIKIHNFFDLVKLKGGIFISVWSKKTSFDSYSLLLLIQKLIFTDDCLRYRKYLKTISPSFIHNLKACIFDYRFTSHNSIVLIAINANIFFPSISSQILSSWSDVVFFCWLFISHGLQPPSKWSRVLTAI